MVRGWNRGTSVIPSRDGSPSEDRLLVGLVIFVLSLRRALDRGCRGQSVRLHSALPFLVTDSTAAAAATAAAANAGPVGTVICVVTAIMVCLSVGVYQGPQSGSQGPREARESALVLEYQFFPLARLLQQVKRIAVWARSLIRTGQERRHRGKCVNYRSGLIKEARAAAAATIEQI